MRFGTPYGSYSLTQLPGSPQVCVSHGAFIFESYRGDGHGGTDHQARLTKIKELGYDLAICTVVATNEAQRHILIKNLWSPVKTFRSGVSGHMVELWIRDMHL